MSAETARALLRPLLARRLSPAERRALAAALRQLAEEQERLAAAEQAEQRRPAPQRLVGSGSRTGRPGARTIYLEMRNERGRSEPVYALRIGRGVYDAYQALRSDPARPLRLAVQRVGRQLRLVEDSGGYAVTVTVGGVRVNVSGMRDELGDLPAGVRWPATVDRLGIVVDLGAG